MTVCPVPASAEAIISRMPPCAPHAKHACRSAYRLPGLSLTGAAADHPGQCRRRGLRGSCPRDGRAVPAFPALSASPARRRRHGDDELLRFRAMVEDTPIETIITEFRADGRLIGGCLTDRLGDGFSAVYSFYAPDWCGSRWERRDPVDDRARQGGRGCPTSTWDTGCQRAARWPTKRGSGPARC